MAVNMLNRLIILLLGIAFVGCGSSPSGNNNEVVVIGEKTPKNDIITPIKNYNGEDNILFAFIGEKIAVDECSEGGPFLSENKYKATYKVVEKIYGEFQYDTIEFVVYDHSGVPAFSKFTNVLLYTSADSGYYYHQKNMYNEIYQTKDGKWASPYSVNDYEHIYNQNTTIKPHKIEFAEEISYQIDTSKYSEEDIKYFFPEPYFNILGAKATAVYGNYPGELFKLKRDGYLTARKIFNSNAK